MRTSKKVFEMQSSIVAARVKFLELWAVRTSPLRRIKTNAFFTMTTAKGNGSAATDNGLNSAQMFSRKIERRG